MDDTPEVVGHEALTVVLPPGGERTLLAEIEHLRARIDRMTANCEWCQEGASPSGGFSPCPLHEGAEEGTVTKDEVNGHFVFACPNCKRKYADA